ncbi:hypothetical protein A2U01_0010135, partial [Trifolium medium]|nr:hypothetical protein [Trifolium medium]
NQVLDLDTLAPLGPWIRSTQYGRRKMEDKDKKFYSNPSHSKNFGHYSPSAPSDLLEKLAAMKVNIPHDTPVKNNQPNQGNQHTQSNDNPSMTDLQATTEDISKKAHRLTYSNEAMNMELTQDMATQNQSFQEKRQKMEDLSRGLGNPKTVRAFKKLITNHHSDIIFLMETKLLDSQFQFLNTYRDSYTLHTINCSVTGQEGLGGLP